MKVIDQDMRLSPIGEGRYGAFVDAGWNISDNPNGGFLVSIVLAAMAQSIRHQDPLSVTTHYLRPGSADEPCEVEIDVLRQGRTVSTLRGRLVQAGKVRLEVIAAFGDLREGTGVEQALSLPVPEMPPVEACVRRSGELQNITLPINDKVDVRLHPDQVNPGASSRAEVSGWVRLADDSPVTTSLLVLFADCFPPSVFPLLGRVGWVPTLELTVHVRRQPVPGWILAQFRTDDLHNGRMIESGCLWDSSGNLVAQSRQLGLVLKGD